MIINLIQALYDPRTPLPADLELYKQTLEDIDFFSIGPQIYYLLKQQEKLELTPPFFKNRVQQKYNEALYQNIFIKHETHQILDKFERSGISVIPLKGVIFTEKYFGHIGARGTSDIDLLIKTDDLEKAIACIKSLGFTIQGQRIPSHFHCSFAKPLTGSPLPLSVELHWNLLTENTSDFKIHELWNEANPLKQYKHVMEMSDYHTFYMICLHGWKHALNSLKYFLDIMQMIHIAGDRLDYAKLFEDAASHKTFKRMANTLSIVYSQFPHLEDVKPLPFQKRTRLWWDYNALRNQNARTFMNYVRLVQYQWFDFDQPKHSLEASYQYLRSVLKN